MTSAVSVFGHKSEFDSFLFAPVGEEKNGMLLSVLSALARLDVDPWQEAATLTKMPAQDATLRLTSLLSSLPSDAATVVPPSTVIRLISLLPRIPLHDSRPRERALVRYWIIAFYFLMTFILMFARGLLKIPPRRLRQKELLIPAKRRHRRRRDPVPLGASDNRTPINTGLDPAGESLPRTMRGGGRPEHSWRSFLSLSDRSNP